MTTLNTARPGTKGARPVDYDAVVIGAGFGGLYMLHKLRDELGLDDARIAALRAAKTV